MRKVKFKVALRYIRMAARNGYWVAGLFKFGGHELFELHDRFGLRPGWVKMVFEKELSKAAGLFAKAYERDGHAFRFEWPNHVHVYHLNESCRQNCPLGIRETVQ